MNQSTSKKENQFQFLQIIGATQFYTNYVGQNKQNKQYCFIKKISKQFVDENVQLKQHFINEFEFFKQNYNHPSITQIIQSYQTTNSYNVVISQKLQLFTNFLENQNGMLEEQEALYYIYQIITAYSFLKSKKIPKRDFSLNNIYKNGQLIVIDDWGFIKAYNSYNKQGKYLSNCFMSPEELNNQYMENISEIWSIGIMLYMILFNTLPWQILFYFIIIHIRAINPTQLQFPLNKNYVGIEVQQLLLQMLQPNPKNRINWDQLVNHSIFKQKIQQLNPKQSKHYKELKSIFQFDQPNFNQQQENYQQVSYPALNQSLQINIPKYQPQIIQRSKQESNNQPNYPTLISQKDFNQSLNKTNLLLSSTQNLQLNYQQQLNQQQIQQYEEDENFDLNSIYSQFSLYPTLNIQKSQLDHIKQSQIQRNYQESEQNYYNQQLQIIPQQNQQQKLIQIQNQDQIPSQNQSQLYQQQNQNSKESEFHQQLNQDLSQLPYNILYNELELNYSSKLSQQDEELKSQEYSQFKSIKNNIDFLQSILNAINVLGRTVTDTEKFLKNYDNLQLWRVLCFLILKKVFIIRSQLYNELKEMLKEGENYNGNISNLNGIEQFRNSSEFNEFMSNLKKENTAVLKNLQISFNKAESKVKKFDIEFRDPIKKYVNLNFHQNFDKIYFVLLYLHSNNMENRHCNIQNIQLISLMKHLIQVRDCLLINEEYLNCGFAFPGLYFSLKDYNFAILSGDIELLNNYMTKQKSHLQNIKYCYNINN